MTELPREYRSDYYNRIYEKKNESYYSKGKMLIGWWWKSNYHMWKKIFDQSNFAHRTVSFTDNPKIFVLARTGSGKTVLMERMISCLAKSGYSCVVLSDIKDEYRYLQVPLQDKLRKFIPQNLEEPEGLPVCVVRPLFFKKYLNENDESVKYFQFSYKDISSDILKEFIGESKYDDIILKWFSKSETIEELISNISENEKAKNLIRSLENLKEYGIIGEDARIDFTEIINSGKILIFNIKGYRQTHDRYYKMYLKLAQKKIVDARMNGKIKNKIVMFVDEAHDIIHAGSEDTLTKEVVYQIRTSRSFGVSYVFASQDFESVHPAVFGQSTCFFISSNMLMSDLWKIKNMTQEFHFHPQWKEKLSSELRHIKEFGGFRAWLKLDSKGKQTSMYVFMPIGGHKEGKKY